MRYLLFLLICFSTIVSFAQSDRNDGSKEILSFKVLNKWHLSPRIDISRSGKYLYFTKQDPFSYGVLLVIKDLEGKHYVEAPCYGEPHFSSDSRKIIWMRSSDTLCVMNLKDFGLSYIADVEDFWVCNDFLLYRVSKPSRNFFVVNLINGKEKSFSTVIQFKISGNGRYLVLWRQFVSSVQSLSLVNLYDGKIFEVWEGKKIDLFIVDSNGSQVAFLTEGVVLIYNRFERRNLVKLKCTRDDFSINRLIAFSRDNKNIFVTVKNVKKITAPEWKGELTIWSYWMKRFPPELHRKIDEKDFLATISLSDQQIQLLEYPDELVYFPGYEKLTDSICLIYKSIDSLASYDDIKEGVWELLNTRTGVRRQLEFTKNATFALMSLGGRYVVYYDKIQKNYFSYEITTGELINITKKTPVLWGKDVERGIYGYRYICGWLTDDKALLIYGEDDIWQVDPAGVRAPIRLTNGYGAKHGLKFFLALDDYCYRFLSENESLVLSAFDPITKNNGFYMTTIGKSRDPDSLTMGAYLYCISENPWVPSYYNFLPIRAANASKYIVRRMSSTEAPNFFITSDFKSFQQITDIAPQKEFNWYTAELHKWQSLDGRELQGILYKPENFETTRKYPVIFCFYERMSDRLNTYIQPDVLTGGSSINIPYYVSNGYTVFCPDIHYKRGDPMQGTYDAVISAANYVSELPFVDSKKMGMQGSSWGAIQVNYLITHTSLFAAACSVSGLSDWISGYGSLMADRVSAQEMYEDGQLRVGGTLWDKPEIYIKNSAVLNADKVTTPLLMMHTTDDELCAFSNALEFFTALRRLGKRSWLLQYEGNHTLFGKDAEDFSIRMKQFFDHYLMDKPAPRWMTQTLKQDDTGLELDDNLKAPGEGLNVK
ncbi:alpha/beta hydrolase family protein [Chitinophaga sp. W3I9]|uniref:alpha/beta hydrolase family protein n=1 Tax=Chitinophaga sp. W3I9 TaxID=3373924 RepID=UPI003D19BAF0